MPFPLTTIVRIMRRDHFMCCYCDCKATSFESWRHMRLSLDHFKPLTKGGTDDDANLNTACAEFYWRVTVGARYDGIDIDVTIRASQTSGSVSLLAALRRLNDLRKPDD
jgi:hypothetical protein